MEKLPMVDPDYVRLMAAYTRWQNHSVYAAASRLDDAARREERGAWFGSIHATLNHVLWGDQSWMHRLAGTKPPLRASIAESVEQYESWDALCAAREDMDREIRDWAGRVSTEDLAGELAWYSGVVQAEIRRPRWALVVQLFNHSTHHRGQVHAMLTAAGANPEDTDVRFMPDGFYPWPA